MFKKPLINNQIRANEIRLIDETGKQVGILALSEALRMASEKGLDLIQITEKVEPPVCRIMDYGKYLYREKKKEKPIKSSQGELKGIRLSFGISDHDIKIRAKQAEKFLKEGNKVKIELVLRGREKALGDFAKEKLKKFLIALELLIPIETEREIKREGRGFTMIIAYERKILEKEAKETV